MLVTRTAVFDIFSATNDFLKRLKATLNGYVRILHSFLEVCSSVGLVTINVYQNKLNI